jgi:beta-galactosidase
MVPYDKTMASPRSRVLFNDSWRFCKGDPNGVEQHLDYARLKDWLLPTSAGFLPATTNKPVRPNESHDAGAVFADPFYDDSNWRSLDLPHDWGIEGPFKQEYPGETGKLPWWGVGWYRKHFSVMQDYPNQRIYLEIDGAMSYAMVWLNGRLVGGWPYGYTSFRIELTPYIHWGEENVVAIRLHNPEESSRWYPGGGLYRNVWLVKTAAVAVVHWGSFVTTPMVTATFATVDVQIVLENHLHSVAPVDIVTELFELTEIGATSTTAVAVSDVRRVKIPADSQAFISHSMQIEHPRLWNLQHPHRYKAIVRVERKGEVLDLYETVFGIRTIAFTPDQGFFLNGELVKIQGVCMHHDLGALGTALHMRALERQIEILQEMGCNAIRTSHNPPAPELLDLCDRMGVLVMDEAFDCWRKGKKPNDYNLLFPDWHEQDLRALIRRDRNHPCVILWSIGNEVPDQWQPAGWKLAAHLAAIVREEDRTRSVTAGFNNSHSGYNGFQTAVDVVGFNYKPDEYEMFHRSSPHIPVLGSETSSCVSSRGEYFFPVSEDKARGRADFQVSSYDLYAPPWAFPPDVEFRGLDEHPYAAGEFVWTGFDYLGEPTPYNQDTTTLLNFSNANEAAQMKKELESLGRIPIPSRSSYFGIVDLAGFKKDRFYLYQSRWRPDHPMVHILPHWNWPERMGQVTPVHVYTSGDEVELYLNGTPLGRMSKEKWHYRLQWDDVRYEPGELLAIAFKNGKEWARCQVCTSGEPARLTLMPDRSTILADGRDLSFVTLALVDKNGAVVPTSSPLIQFMLSGPGDIVAVDNGDATSHCSFQATERKAYNSLALVIIRSRTGQMGSLQLEAHAKGLEPASCIITSTN